MKKRRGPVRYAIPNGAIPRQLGHEAMECVLTRARWFVSRGIPIPDRTRRTLVFLADVLGLAIADIPELLRNRYTAARAAQLQRAVDMDDDTLRERLGSR